MKKFGVALAVISIFLLITVAYAQGPGMSGGEEGWNFCPYCGGYIGPRGGYGMGPGMMGGYGRGYGMGPGMMGGYGMHPGARGDYSQSEECQKFFEDTSKERKILHDKIFEYHEAYRKPETTKETLVNMEKEIRDIQEKIYSKAPRGCWWQQ
jgi:hypothetical protein